MGAVSSWDVVSERRPRMAGAGEATGEGHFSEAKHLLFVFDSQTLPFVHVERPGTLAVAVAFRAVLLPVAGIAVDLGVVNGQCGAVQVLPADH